MITPKISIIVPVYNTEKYILECLESIAAQTFRDFEAILINDGSTDGSEALISQFIQENQLSSFFLVSQENKGLCAARNAGLTCAKGEWIAFIDSDDWIGPDYLKDMMDAVAGSDAEFCLTQYRAFEVSTERYEVWFSPPSFHGTIPEDLHKLPSFDYACGRMYRRAVIEEHGLTFDSRIKGNEDNAFNFDYISVIKAYACVNGDFYTYRRGREGALTSSLVLPHMRVHFADHCRDFCNTFGFSVIAHALEHNISLSQIMWNVLSTSVITDILDSNYSAAREKLKDPLSKVVMDVLVVRSRKAQLLLFLFRHSFPALVAVVKLYYGNFEFLRKHKRLFHYISHK